MQKGGQLIIIRLKGDKPGIDVPGDFYDSICDDIEAAINGAVTTVVDPAECTLPAYALHDLEAGQ